MEDNPLGRRLAVVDCGTNTFTLHVADAVNGDWHSVFRQRRFVRLGRDSFRSGRLSPQRFRRGIDVLKSFRDTAANFNVDHVAAFGCSALRDAHNGPEFVEVAGTIGWDIRILDGPTEAHLIHMGVSDSVRERTVLPPSLMTVDIGGGSVELIHWSPEGVMGKWSLDMGVARLTDWIKPSDPLKPADVASVHRVMDAALGPVLESVRVAPPQWMVGTSGAFNSLMDMQDARARWRDSRTADEFDRTALRARCAALSRVSQEDLAHMEDIHPDRIPYMAMACVVIDHLLNSFPSVERVFRSRNTLAEGVLVEAAAVVGEAAMQAAGWVPFTD